MTEIETQITKISDTLINTHGNEYSNQCNYAMVKISECTECTKIGAVPSSVELKVSLSSALSASVSGKLSHIRCDIIEVTIY